MIDLLASRDTYEAYGKHSKGKDRRFSNRIAPFYPGAKKRRPFVKAPVSSISHKISPIQRVGTSFKRKKQVFKTVNSKNINFTFSVPKAFSTTEDTLFWNRGVLRLDKTNSFIELEATPVRCEGGKTAQRLCLKEHSAKFKEVFHGKVPSFNSVKDTTLSVHLTPPSDPNGLNLAEHLVLRNLDYKVHLISFVEPTNRYIWALKIGTKNRQPRGLNDKNVVTQIIYSLFQDPTKKPKRATRVSSTKRIKHFSQRKNNISPFVRTKTKKIETAQVPFQLQVPEDFELVTDQLTRSGGALQLLGENTNLFVISTSHICEGDGQNQDKTVRRIIRECLKERSSDFVEELRPKHILHDEYIPITLTFEGGKYEEMAHFLMTLNGSQRQVLLTFREPKNNFVWFVELENYRPESFLDDSRDLKRLFSSLLFR